MNGVEKLFISNTDFFLGKNAEEIKVALLFFFYCIIYFGTIDYKRRFKDKC